MEYGMRNGGKIDGLKNFSHDFFPYFSTEEQIRIRLEAVNRRGQGSPIQFGKRKQEFLV